jgi:hypothetical protein
MFWKLFGGWTNQYSDKIGGLTWLGCYAFELYFSLESHSKYFIYSEILEEDNVPSYGSGTGTGYGRNREPKRESIATVISPEYEREILQVWKISVWTVLISSLIQRNRDLSVTFGFKEGGSTQDLRYSWYDMILSSILLS